MEQTVFPAQDLEEDHSDAPDVDGEALPLGPQKRLRGHEGLGADLVAAHDLLVLEDDLVVAEVLADPLVVAGFAVKPARFEVLDFPFIFLFLDNSFRQEKGLTNSESP